MSGDIAERPFENEEDERRRLARELHDDIGQRVALLADDAERLRREMKLTDDRNRHRLENLVHQARELSEDLRRLAHTLHPAVLEDLGLVSALRSLAEDFTDRTGLSAHLDILNVPRELPSALSTSVYRIVQEALRNIAKHAGETEVQIRLHAAAGELVLIVSDSGAGFDTTNQAGLGLTSMRERAFLADGSFSITSAPGKGTTVQVHIPFADARAT